MELVYLWVEEYKNIKNQGFNFSPRFTCKYEDGKLTIDEKEHVSIFPDNINVTAIVGENGSGKSSIIDILQEGVENNLYTEYILVFIDDNNKLKYISNNTIVSDLPQGVCKELAQNTVVYNKSNHISHPFRYYNLIEIDKKAIVNILVTKCDNPEFKISTFMYLPIEIEIKLKDSETLIQETINFFMPLNREKIKQIFTSITDLYHQYLFITYGREQGMNCDIDILTNKKTLKNAAQNPISEENYYTYLAKLINEEIFNITELTEKEKNIYIKEGGYFHFFHFDMIDEKNRRFNNLSHGEQMIFGQLLNIYFYSNSNNNLIFLFDEPEISLHVNWQKSYIKELYTLLKKLEKNYHFIFTSHSPFLLSDLPKENVIFLDTYKEDTTDNSGIEQKKGNCKIVNPNINTFGANIHTLLSHGFFMKDGLMGEFAKGKINEIIEFYKKVEQQKEDKTKKEELKTEYEKNRKQFWHIQSIVGEEYLKQVIKNHLVEMEKLLLGKDEVKKAEIARLQKQIELLEKEND